MFESLNQPTLASLPRLYKPCQILIYIFPIQPNQSHRLVIPGLVLSAGDRPFLAQVWPPPHTLAWQGRFYEQAAY